MRVGTSTANLPRAQDQDGLRLLTSGALQRLIDAINRNESWAKIFPSAADLPAAAEEHRGKLATVIGAGGAGIDELQVCLETSTGVFAWVTVV